MTGLPNLARISAPFRATTDDGKIVYDFGTDAALIAAAPAMAALLIECEEALRAQHLACTHITSVGGVPTPSDIPCSACLARAALARLADFDKGIG